MIDYRLLQSFFRQQINKLFEPANEYLNRYSQEILNKINPDASGFFFKDIVIRLPKDNNKIVAIPREMTEELIPFYEFYKQLQKDKEYTMYFFNTVTRGQSDPMANIPPELGGLNNYTLNTKFPILYENISKIINKYEAMKLL